MKPLEVYFRKDLRQLIDEPSFILLVVICIVTASLLSVLSENAFSGIVNNYSNNPLTHDQLVSNQKGALISYWESILTPMALFVFISSSLSMTPEKETGILRYTLSYRRGKCEFFISKATVQLFIAFLFAFTSIAAFTLAYYFSNYLYLSVDFLLASTLFPFLFLATSSSIGILISCLTRKKLTAVLAAVMVFFVVTTCLGLIVNSGFSEAQQNYIKTHPGNPMMTNGQMRELYPSTQKLIVAISPMTTMQGLYLYLGLNGDDGLPFYIGSYFCFYGLDYYILLPVISMVVVLAAGLYVFRSERIDDYITLTKT
jgi:ABC-type transport system involved in multi-copper enzyme maturation permease subunit